MPGLSPGVVVPIAFTSAFAFSSRFTFASLPFSAARTSFAPSLDIAPKNPRGGRQRFTAATRGGAV